MNAIKNKILLAGDKFMPEMYLKQPRFTYSACRSFIDNKERIQKFNKTGDSRYIYQSELDEAWFQHDMVYADLKDLPRRTASDKVLRDKHLILLKIQNMIDINKCLVNWFKNVLIKRISTSIT